METSNNNFIEASKRERFAFKQFIEKYKLFKEDDYSIYLTPEYGYDKYDALIQKFNNDSYICEKRYITEFKIRMFDNKSNSTLRKCREEGFIFETKKYNGLVKISKLDPDKNEILYINFLPDSTIIWNISLLEKKGLLKKTNKYMNVATMKSRSDKKDKKIYLLKEEWGKKYNYIFDERSYQAHLSEKENLKKIRKNITKQMSVTINSILGI